MQIDPNVVESLNISTPALIFPAISLLLLAYTNRFLTIGQLIRSLYKQLNESEEGIKNLEKQLLHLRGRIFLIRMMQAFGVGAFMACTASMAALLIGWTQTGFVILTASIVMLFVSLCISLVEILQSGYALNIQLQNLEQHEGKD
ncbi:DUF2721 domain-containing protein [Salinibius halmophilus]|uniref:DUF2721 domain-containing protein n=1 Tax=Salinibius halmophilus TaxID=1853216 RepID=UPI000E67403E|nr:DUF2721 domain-containing protein [Salinibius halmophilus]